MNRILIIGPSWVGDMVMAQSLFKTLKQQKPDCTIDVMAPAWSLPILARMPEVSRGIVMPFQHGELKLGQRMALGKQLQGQYDRAFILPNSLKSALIPFFAGIKIRSGWRGEMRFVLLNDIRLLNKKKLPLMVQRFVALAYPPGASLPDELPRPKLLSTPSTQQAILNKLNLEKSKKILILCPGAEFGAAKQWPEAHYAQVANKKIAEGWQVWILGSKNDVSTAETIVHLIDPDKQTDCVNLAGQTALEESIDLIAVADLVLCNDSGLMHIAAAVETPLGVIYGSTSPDFTPPLSQRVVIFKSDIACSPCFRRRCPYGHTDCLKQQTPEKIISGLEKLLSSA
jgi:heptosyltransferase-2